MTEPTIDVSPGQIVLLNGVSSSGKSSIARQLLVDLESPFFHIGVDMIGAMRSDPEPTNSIPQRSTASCDEPELVSTARSPEWPGPETTSSRTTSSASHGAFEIAWPSWPASMSSSSESVAHSTHCSAENSNAAIALSAPQPDRSSRSTPTESTTSKSTPAQTPSRPAPTRSKHSSAEAHPIEHSISFARQQTSDP